MVIICKSWISKNRCIKVGENLKQDIYHNSFGSIIKSNKVITVYKDTILFIPIFQNLFYFEKWNLMWLRIFFQQDWNAHRRQVEATARM